MLSKSRKRLFDVDLSFERCYVPYIMDLMAASVSLKDCVSWKWLAVNRLFLLVVKCKDQYYTSTLNFTMEGVLAALQTALSLI